MRESTHPLSYCTLLVLKSEPAFRIVGPNSVSGKGINNNNHILLAVSQASKFPGSQVPPPASPPHPHLRSDSPPSGPLGARLVPISLPLGLRFGAQHSNSISTYAEQQHPLGCLSFSLSALPQSPVLTPPPVGRVTVPAIIMIRDPPRLLSLRWRYSPRPLAP